MAAYVDWAFYIIEFGGAAIADSEFPGLANRATLMMDTLTFGRAKPVMDASSDTELIYRVKMATCAVAEQLKAAQGADGVTGGIKVTSEKVGDYSVSKGFGGPEAELSIQGRCYQAAEDYLVTTKLMCRWA
ncbi:MAG: hypothetical protein ABFD29_10500 [Anaerolineaceae bacterium]